MAGRIAFRGPAGTVNLQHPGLPSELRRQSKAERGQQVMSRYFKEPVSMEVFRVQGQQYPEWRT